MLGIHTYVSTSTVSRKTVKAQHVHWKQGACGVKGRVQMAKRASSFFNHGMSLEEIILETEKWSNIFGTDFYS